MKFLTGYVIQVFLMVIALLATSAATLHAQLQILILHADCGTAPVTLQNDIASQAGVSQVDMYYGGSATPTLAALQAYDIVVALSNCGWADPNGIGDNLADYYDGGGTVVTFNFNMYSSTTASQNLRGRWQTGGYNTYTIGTTNFASGSLGTYNSADPLMQGVTTLNSVYRQNLPLSTGSTLVASWSDGTALVAFKGRHVGVSAYVGDGAGQWSGDYGRLVVNAANVGGAVPPTMSVVLAPTLLWPANHSMTTVNASVSVSGGTSPSWVLQSITSSEADAGLDGGDIPADIQGASYGTADAQYQLRAERANAGSGRFYTLTYELSDVGGFSSTITEQVAVPYNLGSIVPGGTNSCGASIGAIVQTGPTAQIPVTLTSASNVTLAVYSTRGKEIARLLNGSPLAAGTTAVTWDGRNTVGTNPGTVQNSDSYIVVLKTCNGAYTAARIASWTNP